MTEATKRLLDLLAKRIDDQGWIYRIVSAEKDYKKISESIPPNIRYADGESPASKSGRTGISLGEREVMCLEPTQSPEQFANSISYIETYSWSGFKKYTLERHADGSFMDLCKMMGGVLNVFRAYFDGYMDKALQEFVFISALDPEVAYILTGIRYPQRAEDAATATVQPVEAA